MAQDEMPTGVHDEWLTAELARLKGGGGKGFPLIPLIGSLHHRTGMGLKDSRKAVEDYARRHDIKITAWDAGQSPWLTFPFVAILVWLIVWQVRTWLTLPHDEDYKHLAAGSALIIGCCLWALVLQGLALRRQIQARRQP